VVDEEDLAALLLPLPAGGQRLARVGEPASCCAGNPCSRRPGRRGSSAASRAGCCSA